MSFSSHLAQTSPYPLGLEIVESEGCYLYDKSGKRYLDLISGLAVSNVGHCHPEVVSAIKAQSDRFLHLIPYGEISQAPQNLLAEKLATILPPSLNSSYFVNSGTEANEAALKLAKRATSRHEFFAIKGSYHGATHGSLSVTGNETKKSAFRPFVPGSSFIELNNTQQLELINERTAAVIIEPILGDAGVRIPEESYIKALRKRCDETGALLIFDEIQTGFGRTGKMFAFEHFNVIPDILTIAKALGGGMPIGAFVSSVENMSQLTHSPMLGHITTFGGNPVCCAAALANINILLREPWIEDVDRKGKRFKERLDHKAVVELRQIGLMMAVELASEGQVSRVIHSLLEKGVIGFYFLSCRNAFRLAPPLCITMDQIDFACDCIAEALDALD